MDKHYVGLDITGFEDNGKKKPISRITLQLDNDNYITAGDDTGLEIIASCAHGTQEMADTILSRLKGYQYQMFTADAANLDPAAELGDGVTVGGVYGVISRLNDNGGYPDIEATGESELEDEYPTGSGPVTNEINRQLADTRAYITRTAEEIRLTVEGLDGNYSELKQTIDGFTFSSSEGEVKIRGSAIEAGSLNLSGLITFDDLEEDLQKDIDSIGDMVTEEIVHTLISEDLVESPTIRGAHIQGGVFNDISGKVSLAIKEKKFFDEYTSAELSLRDENYNELFRTSPIFAQEYDGPVTYVGSAIYISDMLFVQATPLAQQFLLGANSSSMTFKFMPNMTVDFTGANVIGLNN